MHVTSYNICSSIGELYVGVSHKLDHCFIRVKHAPPSGSISRSCFSHFKKWRTLCREVFLKAKIQLIFDCWKSYCLWTLQNWCTLKHTKHWELARTSMTQHLSLEWDAVRVTEHPKQTLIWNKWLNFMHRLKVSWTYTQRFLSLCYFVSIFVFCFCFFVVC